MPNENKPIKEYKPANVKKHGKVNVQYEVHGQMVKRGIDWVEGRITTHTRRLEEARPGSKHEKHHREKLKFYTQLKKEYDALGKA